MQLMQLTSLGLSVSLLLPPAGAFADPAVADRLDQAAKLAAGAVGAAGNGRLEDATAANAQVLDALGAAEGLRFEREQTDAVAAPETSEVHEAALRAKIEGLDAQERQQLVEFFNAGEGKMLAHHGEYGYVRGWEAGFAFVEAIPYVLWHAGDNGVIEPFALLGKIGAVILGAVLFIPALVVATFISGPVNWAMDGHY